MASDKSTGQLIDIDSPISSTSGLQFQDFPIEDTSSVAKLNIDSYSSGSEFPNTVNTDNDPIDDSNLKNQLSSLFSIEYYQRLFDVNTNQVIDRILWAMIPKPGVNYLQHHIASKPDLYGPFWICVTLVFTIAISGNIANYFQTVSAHTPNHHWKYDFHAVTFCATAIFAYAWFLPVILWAVIKWQGSEVSQVGLIELLCVYGYSLSIYIPVSILWLIQIGWLQWLLVLLGAAMSGSILVTSIWPAFKDRSAILLASILGFHLLLATVFMLYFFHPPSVNNEVLHQSSAINNSVIPNVVIKNHNLTA